MLKNIVLGNRGWNAVHSTCNWNESYSPGTEMQIPFKCCWIGFKKLIVYETDPAKRNNFNPDKVQIAVHTHIHHSSSTKLRSTTEEQNALCEWNKIGKLIDFVLDPRRSLLDWHACPSGQGTKECGPESISDVKNSRWLAKREEKQVTKWEETTYTEWPHWT